MKLYGRDYTKLTKNEEAEWRRVKKLETIRVGEFPVSRSRFRQYPRAARHFVHLFPNNYLDVVELKKTAQLKAKLEKFRACLSSTRGTERGIVRLMRDDQSHFIVGSILKQFFWFGHHEAYLFPEFPLGSSHKADYLLVGRSSGGYEFVFVEFEAPAKNITIGKGDLGKAFRNGQAQVADWNHWLAASYQMLSEVFRKHKKRDLALPEEFTTFDPTRMHFVIVAGRRIDFKEKTYRLRRDEQQARRMLILHYDNILDAANRVIGADTY